MKLTDIALCIACLGVGAAVAQESERDPVEERYEHLEKGKSGFQETWVNPNTDFTQYRNIYLWEAEFQYRDVGPARRTRTTLMSTRQREFGISDADRRKFEDIVSEIFLQEINKAKNFNVVDEIGPDTLILRGAVLDIISLVPPDTIGSSEIYLASVGEATLVVELIDAEDGEVVAVASERRAIQSGAGRVDEFSMRTTSVTAFAEVRRWARRGAKKLRTELEKAIGGN